MLAGCSAGFVNLLRLKGVHTAMKTGMLAAESIFQKMACQDSDSFFSDSSVLEGAELTDYQKNVEESWVWKEMYETRNIKGGFSSRLGWLFGLPHSLLVSVLRGREFWNLRNKKTDSEKTQKLSTKPKEIKYEKHDNKLTFNLLENLDRSAVFHDHDQPAHLVIKEGKENIPQISRVDYGAPEEKFCPAGVYEFIENDEGEKQLQINAQNCVHCKACSIKMVDEYIDWQVPEGGQGPNYVGM